MLLSLPAGFRGEGVSKAGNSRLFGGGGDIKLELWPSGLLLMSLLQTNICTRRDIKHQNNNNNSWMEAVSEEK